MILVVGDCLSAGYGMRPGRAGSPCCRSDCSKGYGHRVVNASVQWRDDRRRRSTRLPRARDAQRPAIVILELGGNDGLRGLPVADVRANLELLIRLAAGGRRRPAAGHAHAAELRPAVHAVPRDLRRPARALQIGSRRAPEPGSRARRAPTCRRTASTRTPQRSRCLLDDVWSSSAALAPQVKARRKPDDCRRDARA